MPSSACYGHHQHLHSFPTRRSSDLTLAEAAKLPQGQRTYNFDNRYRCKDGSYRSLQWKAAPSVGRQRIYAIARDVTESKRVENTLRDRKSTRLNSSHVAISYAVFCLLRPPPTPTLFPYTTLFRSHTGRGGKAPARSAHVQFRQPLSMQGRLVSLFAVESRTVRWPAADLCDRSRCDRVEASGKYFARSEEHTSELQSRGHLVCRLLLATATTNTYTLSLHDALPISHWPRRQSSRKVSARTISTTVIDARTARIALCSGKPHRPLAGSGFMRSLAM